MKITLGLHGRFRRYRRPLMRVVNATDVTVVDVQYLVQSPDRPGISQNICNYVGKDFYLATAADIVADPSAPDAFVEGIMENKEWIWDNGEIKAKDIEEYKKYIERAKSIQLAEAKAKVFANFLEKL